MVSAACRGLRFVQTTKQCWLSANQSRGRGGREPRPLAGGHQSGGQGTHLPRDRRLRASDSRARRGQRPNSLADSQHPRSGRRRYTGRRHRAAACAPCATLRPCRTASPARPARTCSSTPTTRSTGSRGAATRSPGRSCLDRPIFLSIGYAACHWCHVMERESFEDETTAAYLNDALRGDQGRPRGAARPRPALHGRRPGDDRAGRLADVGLPDARRPAVLRRHLLPGRAAPRDAVLPPGARRRRAGVARAARRARSRPGRGWSRRSSSAAARRGRRCRRTTRRRARSTRPRPGSRASFDGVNGGWGGAPKFPQPMTIEFLLRRMAAPATRGPSAIARVQPRADGRRRHPRPAGRRLPPLRDRRDLARPALRADALRQRPARPRLPARLGADRRRALPRGRRRARSTTCVRELRDGRRRASRRARTPTPTAIEGADVHLDRGRDPRGAGRRRRAVPRGAYGVTDDGNWEGTHDPLAGLAGRPRRRRRRARTRAFEAGLAGVAGAAARAARRAAAAGPRRQGARGLERAGDRGVRRRRAAPRA